MLDFIDMLIEADKKRTINITLVIIDENGGII